MAQLRTIGAFIENTGLDLLWIESELYGPATVKQIIQGSHVKRAETAHVTTLQALFVIHQEAFFQQSPSSQTCLEQLAKQLNDACTHNSKKKLKEVHNKLLQAIESMQIVKKIKMFDAQHEEIPLFNVMHQYMRMVTEMMSFIQAVRTGDWALHLEALELFTKYFFAHDMLNYACMIPVYLAQMQMLHESDPEIYEEFKQGNWVVNKNSCVPFCEIGADNALEHVNLSMKVTGGLVGITLNPTACTKYFMIAPKLARLPEQAKQMGGTSPKTPTHHHTHPTALRLRQEKGIEQLVTSIQSFTNSFLEEGCDLFNLLTKVVRPEEVKREMCQQSAIGKELFANFVKERIQSSKNSIWSPMKKCTLLLTWKSTGKILRVTTKDKIVELKEDRSLFAGMMMVCKAHPEIDIKEAVGQYEISIVPRSMFAADGAMFHCASKSTLMDILEKLDTEGNTDGSTKEDLRLDTEITATQKVTIVNAMAEVQALENQTGLRIVPNWPTISPRAYLRSTAAWINYDLSVTGWSFLTLVIGN